MEKRWSIKRQAFVQQYGDEVRDASLLKMVQVGFVAAGDPLWQSTLRVIDAELVSDSLVYRYGPSASPGGLLGSEGTFSFCTLLYVDALARSGRRDDEQLGNFPQAFTHLALIDDAITLNDALDKGW